MRGYASTLENQTCTRKLREQTKDREGIVSAKKEPRGKFRNDRNYWILKCKTNKKLSKDRELMEQI